MKIVEVAGYYINLEKIIYADRGETSYTGKTWVKILLEDCKDFIRLEDEEADLFLSFLSAECINNKELM